MEGHISKTLNLIENVNGKSCRSPRFAFATLERVVGWNIVLNIDGFSLIATIVLGVSGPNINIPLRFPHDITIRHDVSLLLA